MAGLIDFVAMGGAVAGIYIAVKYGGQIMDNVKAGSPSGDLCSHLTCSDLCGANAKDYLSKCGAGLQPYIDKCSCSKASTPITEGPQPVAAPPVAASDTDCTNLHCDQLCPNAGYWLKKCGTGLQPWIDSCHCGQGTTHPATTVPTGHVKTKPSNVKEAPPLSLHDQGINVQPPNAGAIHPSKEWINTTHPGHTVRPAGCDCQNGIVQGDKCPDDIIGQKCGPGFPAKLETIKKQAKSYYGRLDPFHYYSVGSTGPEWRTTIPYNELVASSGMATGKRVGRALAANNHNFMPGGFVLSEASVRRGWNNVYSAGT